jgi:hypothetical protein
MYYNHKCGCGSIHGKKQEDWVDLSRLPDGLL